jgi:hypothetical protein
LSGGAKAGIAIGVVVFVIGAAALCWFFFVAGRRRGNSNTAELHSIGVGLQQMGEVHPIQPVELHGAQQAHLA